jgi:hypothetical protein
VAASTEVLIGDADAQHVLIRPLSRTQPDLFDDPDGDAIDCDVEIVAGGFRGDFRAELRSEEFQGFLAEAEGLRRTMEGAATFTTAEGQIALSLTGDGKDRVCLTGDALDVAGSGNRLQFSFELDRAHLAAICQSLDHLLAAFPVTQAADTEQP